MFSTTGASGFKPSRPRWKGGVRTKLCKRYELRTLNMMPQFLGSKNFTSLNAAASSSTVAMLAGTG